MNRKEFYNTLSEDVKAKIKACKTEEEMMRVLDEEKIALDPEVLEGVSGGDCAQRCISKSCNSKCSSNSSC